jgi:predicted dinucleotide-binding enzyme
MKIGIIGIGNIGGTIARKLKAAGHEIRIANSRGRESIVLRSVATSSRNSGRAE